MNRRFSPLSRLACLVICMAGMLVSCVSSDYKPTALVRDGVVVSVRDQKLAVLRQGKVVKTYPVSTSKFGLGDRKGSCRTPLGTHLIAAKIGSGLPDGTVLKNRRPTGERVRPNAPGRDPIVTRIMWLKGLQPWNRNSYARLIYIHGTAEERAIGRPASYGCIRMKSNDVKEAFELVHLGDPVVIERCSLDASLKALREADDAARMKSTTRLPAVSFPVSSVRDF